MPHPPPNRVRSKQTTAELAKTTTEFPGFVVVGRYRGPDGSLSVVSSYDIFEFEHNTLVTITSYAVEPAPTGTSAVSPRSWSAGFGPVASTHPHSPSCTDRLQSACGTGSPTRNACAAGEGLNAF